MVALASCRVHEIGLVHTIDAAHRVVGHEGGRGKCARLHGHTYAFEVKLFGPILDETGFIADFGRIKDLLNEWDHRTLLWDGNDELADVIEGCEFRSSRRGSVVRLPFNPTAENLSRHVAEELLERFPAVVKAEVVCRETAKSSARWIATRAVQVWV